MADDPTALFEEFHRTRRRDLRNQLVESHMGLAVHIARRFDRNGQGDADIQQVAMLGLVKAVDRFDPGREVPFAAFAGRTIEGEIKRHFRDRTWSVRVPRSAKELHLAVRGAIDHLTNELSRAPVVDEVANYLELSRDQVLIGMAAGGARTAGSLDTSNDDDHAPAGASLASPESVARYDHVDERDEVTRLLVTLPEREQRIVRLRFYDGLSQTEIAAEVGVSQMHVSRLLRAALERLREAADAADATGPDGV